MAWTEITERLRGIAQGDSPRAPRTGSRSSTGSRSIGAIPSTQPLLSNAPSPYRARVVRQSGWWVVTIDVPGTQLKGRGRTLREIRQVVDRMVSQWVEQQQEVEENHRADQHAASGQQGGSSVSSSSTSIWENQVELRVEGDIRQLVASVEAARGVADRAALRARQVQYEAVRTLRESNLTMQDIAELMGITKSRVSQLANAEPIAAVPDKN